MKNKLIKNRFEQDLLRIRKVLNALIFIEPIKKGTSFEEMCTALSINFIQSVQLSGMLGTPRTDGGMYVADVGENPTSVDIAEAYLEIFDTVAETGCGFTPKLAIHDNDTIRGYNCLGKALAFGSYLMIHKIRPYLVKTVDHAMCAFKDGDMWYLCDPSAGKIYLMCGTFFRHPNYLWYVSNDSDDFHFNYLVIQDFEEGGLNAIFQSLEFLSNAGWGQGAIAKDVLVDCEIALFEIMQPKLGYHKMIGSIDWYNLRTYLFEGFDDYSKDYAREWLIEAERIRLRRIALEVKHEFEDAVFNAVRTTRCNGKIQEIHQSIISELKTVAHEVINYLTMEFDELGVKVSSASAIYLATLKRLIAQNNILKEYAIDKISAKLLDAET